MTSPIQKTENPSLSDLILLTAAEKTWPGQVPQGGLTDVAQRLRESLMGFPCLKKSNVIHTALTKIDEIKTNQDFLDVTRNILETVDKIRTILAEKGVLAVSQNPYAPLTPTVMVLEALGTLLPLEEINRQRDNERLVKTLYYANKVLEILTQAHAEILTQAHTKHPRTALIDAQPLRLTEEKSSAFAREGNNNQTKPEEFVWCGITFDKRMKLVPFLASCYLKGLLGVSAETFKQEYQNIMDKELNDANMWALLRNIRLKFEGAEKTLPFQVVRNGGIRFVYDSPLEVNPSEEVGGCNLSSENSPEASFLGAPFDPQILTHAQPVEIKKLSEELITYLHLDEKSQHILKTLLTQKEPIHIDMLAQKNHLSVAEINTYVSLILQTLWSAGYVVQITVENDYLQIIT